MRKKKPYSPEVYRRLQLVEKQFQQNTAELRKQRSAERRQRILDAFSRHKTSILRFTIYALMAMLVIAVIVVLFVK